MRRDPRCYLWDIQQATEAIFEFVSGETFSDYEEQRMLRSAVEREFVLIGEAMNRLAHHDEAIAVQITSYRKIIDFRNIIAHDYDDVRNDIVWAMIEGDLQTLLVEVTGLLDDP